MLLPLLPAAHSPQCIQRFLKHESNHVTGPQNHFFKDQIHTILSHKEIYNSFPHQTSVHSSHILQLSLSESLSQTCHAILLLPAFACTVSFSDSYLRNSYSSFKARLKCPPSFSETDILVPYLFLQSIYSGLMSSTLLLSKDIYLFHLPECSPSPSVVRLSWHSSRNRIKASSYCWSVSWTLFFLFLQEKPCHSPAGNLGNIENPGDGNGCWTSWCYWIKSSHNKP